jgi:ferredoxin/flavodoxin---NADP+ reductase
MKDTYQKVQIISNNEIAKDVFVISFPRIFDFKPGQVISIQLFEDSPSRMYSIASGINEDVIRILFNINDLGYLTPKLSKLNVGQSIYISNPFGTFLHDVQVGDFFISSGTGIAPFNSFLQSYKPLGITVLHGSRTLKNFYFEEELKFLQWNYVRCCSREKHESVYVGRLTNYLKDLKHIDLNKTFHLCGSAEMVNEVREILIKRKVPFENIQSEIYF